MRILYVCQTPLDRPTGAAEHVVACVNELSRRHHVVLVGPEGRLPREEGWKSLGIRAPSIPYVRLLVYNARLWRTLRDQAGRHDVAYVRSYPGLVAPAFVSRRLPYVAEANGVREEEMRLAGAPHWQMAVTKHAERLLFGRAAHVVAVTEGVRRYLIASLGITPHRTTVVENGVDPDRYRPIPRDRARSVLDLALEGRYVGFLGSLVPWQGLEDLIAAAGDIDATVLIGGSGPSRAALEAAATPNVRFLGGVPFEKAPLFLAACDVLILSKRPMASGYNPVKLYSYLASQRPVVASKVEGLEMVESSGAGLLYPPGDAAALARAVNSLLASPDSYGNRTGKGAVPRTWTETAHEISDVLARALREG